VIDEFHISYLAGGFLYAIPILMVAILSFPLGIVSDRIGSTKALGLGAAMVALFSLLRATSHSFSSLAFYTAMLGVGVSLYFPNLPKTVRENFPAHLIGRVTGLYTAAIPLGSGLGISLSKPLLVITGSWREVVMILSLIAMPLIAVGWIIVKRSKTKISTESPLPSLGRSKVQKGSRDIENARDHSFSPIILCGILLALLNFVFFITIGWLPTYLASAGWASVSAGAVTSVISFVEVPAILLVPHLSNRAGKGKLIIMMSFLLISMCALATLFHPSLTWIVAPVFGMTFGGAFVLLLAFPAQFTKKEKVGRAAGAILAIGYLGALIGPPFAGYLRDITGSFFSTFMVMAGAGLIAFCLSARFPHGPSTDRGL
jgi:CP family cyanate transporter-like MFS transporter